MRLLPMPRAMRIPPHLDHDLEVGPVTERRALLINPFYPKDPHASFGKHVLTPSLALTSVAGSTPPDWDVAYWDENLSVEELAEGYAWCYRRLFSHRSIWRRRPRDFRAVPPYLAMSYLYKRSNLFWHFLIRHQLTGLVWRPLVEITRRRHLRFRARLAGTASPLGRQTGTVVSPAV
ncbi:MAG: hypothetical protein WD403_14825 [Pirellulales bacterium]